MPLNLNVDRSAKKPLAEQVRHGIATAIESGVLEPGTRLPSWQDLAAQLGDCLAEADESPQCDGCLRRASFQRADA
jgi:hypothetical protein